MKSEVKKGQKFDLIKDILMHYALINWEEPDRKLSHLQKYIEDIKSMNIGMDELDDYVKRMRHQVFNTLELTKSKAVLFTEDKKIRIIKFGSDNCPSCENFKNNERECQHCGFFELILYNN